MKSTTKKVGRGSIVVPALMGIVLAGVLALPVVANAKARTIVVGTCTFTCTIENGMEVCKGNGRQCDGVDPHGGGTSKPTGVKKPIKGDEQKVVPRKESMEQR